MTPDTMEDALLVVSKDQRKWVDDQVKRIEAMNRARDLRAVYFDLKRRCGNQPWLMCQRTFPEERDGFEEMELVRELWRDAIWEMNRHVY